MGKKEKDFEVPFGEAPFPESPKEVKAPVVEQPKETKAVVVPAPRGKRCLLVSRNNFSTFVKYDGDTIRLSPFERVPVENEALLGPLPSGVTKIKA